MTFFRNHRDDTTDHTTPQHGDVRAESFEDEFVRLLENSSLGTPNALAIQAMTTNEVVDRVHDRAEAREHSGRSLGDVTDIDDVLLDVVRSAAAPPDCQQESQAIADSDDRPIWQFVDPVWGTGGFWSLALLPHLIASRVYDYVRRDVAREIVDIVFERALCMWGCGHERVSLLVVIGDRALVRSGVVDDLARHFESAIDHTNAPPDVVFGDHGSVSRYVEAKMPATPAEDVTRVWDYISTSYMKWLRYRPDQDASVSQRLVNHREDSTWTCWSTADSCSSSELTRMLAESIDQFLRGGRRLTADAWHPQWPAIRVAEQITPTAGALLGLLHEGPQSSQILSSTLCRRQAQPEVLHPRVRQELRSLYRSGLVSTMNRVRMYQRQVRYRLTPLGQLAFHHWLLSERDLERQSVALLLLPRIPLCLDMNLASMAEGPASRDRIKVVLQGGCEAEDRAPARRTVAARRILRNVITPRRR